MFITAPSVLFVQYLLLEPSTSRKTLTAFNAGRKNHEPTEQIKSFLTFVHVKQFKQSESAAGKLNFFL